jgi:NADH-quinone oxidoreductase subunit C
MRLRRQNRQ